MKQRLLLLAVALCASGCLADQQLAVIGDQCTINSDCQNPLVCALGRCRVECDSSRDCALGLRCIKLPELVRGVCQLPEEANCSRDSECPEPLLCYMPGGCLQECNEDPDCALGETCNTDMSQCEEPEVPLCLYTTDCTYPEICDDQQRCRRECVNDLDCETGFACVPFDTCNGPCMCRIPCVLDADECPAGTECVECTGASCAVEAYCERPME